jgi:hypothetical protein
MAKEKATITLDREVVRLAMELTDKRTMSEVIDLALSRLVHAERLRRDIEAYRRTPSTEEERAVARLPVRFDLGDDDIDYDTLYGQPE